MYEMESMIENQNNKNFYESMRPIEKVEDVLKKLEYKLALAGKHNLDYSIMYHDRHGGYDMDKLTQVLKDMKQDRESKGLSLENILSTPKSKNGIVAGQLDSKLSALMMERIKKDKPKADSEGA